MMNTKLIHLQDHSWVCAPPQHGLRRAVPRKNAFTVGLPKSLGAQVLAGCEQARSTATLTPRTGRVRQRLVRLYPSQGRLRGALQSGSKTVLRGSQLGAEQSFDFNFRLSRVSLHCMHTYGAFQHLNASSSTSFFSLSSRLSSPFNSIKNAIHITHASPSRRGLV